MTNGPRPRSPDAIDTASSMSSNSFGTPSTLKSEVGSSGFRALENSVLMSADQWAVGAVAFMLDRCRVAVIKEHMRRTAEAGAWR